VLNQFGAPLHAPVPTESELDYHYQTPDEVRVSPDGTKIAYEYKFGAGFSLVDTTVWTPSNSTSATNFPHQVQGQTDNLLPAWIDNSHLLLTDTGLGCFYNDPAIRTYHVGDGDDSTVGWFDDAREQFCPSDAGVTGEGATISRDGGTVAVLEDDAANYLDGRPRNVVVRLYTTNGPAPAAPTYRCQISLPAGKFVNGNGFFVGQNFISPTFSPDGNQLAWSDLDGIHIADTSNLSNCSSVTQQLLVPGGAEPYFSPAPLQTPVRIAGSGVQFAFRHSTSIPVSWTGDGGPYDIRYRSAPWNGGFGASAAWRTNTTATGATLAGAPGRTYCFSGRDHGTATWGPERCTAVPLDDRAMAGSWTRKSARGFYFGTYSLATKKGATLTRSGARAKQVAILAETCPTCGSISLTWSGAGIGSVNLHSSRRHVMFFYVKFASMRTGTFAVKVSSSGKPVQVDGVAFSQV